VGPADHLWPGCRGPLESAGMWNNVSNSRERIEQAKADWKSGRFAPVPGDSDFSKRVKFKTAEGRSVKGRGQDQREHKRRGKTLCLTCAAESPGSCFGLRIV
jgi:Pirin C-terminal cupin domain